MDAISDAQRLFHHNAAMLNKSSTSGYNYNFNFNQPSCFQLNNTNRQHADYSGRSQDLELFLTVFND